MDWRLLKAFFTGTNFYTNLDSAISELHRRREDTLLTKQIENKLKLDSALIAKLQEPKIVLFRQVASPLHETIRVIDIAQEKGLKPLIFEFCEDKFVSARNQFKRGLGKLPIYNGTNSKGQDIFKYKNIVNFPAYAGLPLCEVQTIQNQSLIDLHHELLEYITKVNLDETCIDISEWLAIYDLHANGFYKYVFQIFIQHAILAEIYLTNGYENKLTKNVIAPAFKDVYSMYGKKPLIWSYLPPHEEVRQFWNCYPKKVDAYLTNKGYS